jgi:histidinol-phosphate aminotransferase
VTIASLARPEIRELRAYKPPVLSDDAIRMNCNEAAHAIGTRKGDGLNRYPAVRPLALTQAMARLYEVAADNVLVTRGSSEAIDLLIRTFCTAGRDAVLITPPAFEMYQFYANLQGAATVSVPLQADRDFAIDVDAVLAACDDRTKLIMLCSPNNPVGTVIPAEEILRMVKARAGQSVVVVDEAYIEYSDNESLAGLVNSYENLVVLRTLSKAHALAGVRCGALIAGVETARLLDAVLPPYSLASPVITSAMLSLSDDRLTESRALVDATIAERERLRAALADCKVVDQISPSQANFLFVRLRKLSVVKQNLESVGIAIRFFGNDAKLNNCVRITIGTAEENQRLLDTLRSLN